MINRKLKNAFNFISTPSVSRLVYCSNNNNNFHRQTSATKTGSIGQYYGCSTCCRYSLLLLLLLLNLFVLSIAHDWLTDRSIDRNGMDRCLRSKTILSSVLSSSCTPTKNSLYFFGFFLTECRPWTTLASVSVFSAMDGYANSGLSSWLTGLRHRTVIYDISSSVSQSICLSVSPSWLSVYMYVNARAKLTKKPKQKNEKRCKPFLESSFDQVVFLFCFIVAIISKSKAFY